MPQVKNPSGLFDPLYGAGTDGYFLQQSGGAPVWVAVGFVDSINSIAPSATNDFSIVSGSFSSIGIGTTGTGVSLHGQGACFSAFYGRTSAFASGDFGSITVTAT